MPFHIVILFLLVSLCYPLLARAEMLQGGVQMSEALPAVQPDLRAGAAFNPANLPQAATVGGWYLIPAWAAGTWHRDTMTYVTSQGEQTVLSKVNHFWGQQMDSQGRIWQHHNEPYTEREEMPGLVEWKTVVEKEPLKITPKEMKMHFKASTVAVNAQTGMIVKSYQQEEVQFLRPAEPGYMVQDSYIRLFDEMGRPQSTEHGGAQLTLYRPFSPIPVDQRTGLDLKNDLANYMSTHGFKDGDSPGGTQ
jgi:hypothetical protein